MAVDTSSVPAARISVVGAAATAFAALIAEPIPVKYVAVAASASGEAIRNDIRHLQNVRIAKPCRPEHRLASIDPSAQLTIATRGERHPGFPRSPPPSRYPPLADASWRIRPSHSSAVSPAGARPRASRAPAQAHRPGSASSAGRTRRARQGPVVDCRFTRQPPTLTRRDPLKQVGADAQSRCRRRPRRRRRLLVRQGAAWTEMQDGAACPSRRWRTRRRASAHAALGSGRAAVTLATLAVMVNSVPLPSQPTRLHVSGRRLCHLRLPRRAASQGGCQP